MRNPYDTHYVGRCYGCQDHIDDIEPHIEFWMRDNLLNRTNRHRSHDDIKCITTIVAAEYRGEPTDQLCSGCALDITVDQGGYWSYLERGEEVHVHDNLECFHQALNVEKIDGVYKRAAGW